MTKGPDPVCMHQLNVQDMHSPQELTQPALLTARQVQLMLDVDRSTIYRMADDGRLPAIKVGRQWRFPADRVRALLAVGGPAAPSPAWSDSPTAGTTAATSAVQAAGVEAVVATSVAQVAADLLGVMMVVTDMDGHPLTAVSNPCPWFAERSGDPHLLDACIVEWQQLADDPDFEPHFAVGALGFECARAFVRSGTSLVGMVLVGGVAPPGTDTDGFYQLDDDERHRVLVALPRVAAALSQIGPRGSQSTRVSRGARASQTRSAP
jgi:excisionase family DNA binding protein